MRSPHPLLRWIEPRQKGVTKVGEEEHPLLSTPVSPCPSPLLSSLLIGDEDDDDGDICHLKPSVPVAIYLQMAKG